MRRDRGFTLFELMVVIGIIALIAAITIPRFLEARHGALESSAASYMRSLHQAEVQFQTRENRWAPYSELRSRGYITQEPGAYKITLTVNADGSGYSALGTPLPKPAEMKHFFVDTSGVVRENPGAPADVTSTPTGG